VDDVTGRDDGVAPRAVQSDQSARGVDPGDVHPRRPAPGALHDDVAADRRAGCRVVGAVQLGPQGLAVGGVQAREECSEQALPVDLPRAGEFEGGRGVHRQLCPGLGDVDAGPDEDPLRQHLAEDAAHLAVAVGRDEDVVGPLEARRDRRDVGDRPVDGQTGEQRHPARVRDGREEHGDRERDSRRGGPGPVEPPPTGNLLVGDDDPPGARAAPQLGIRRPDGVPDLDVGVRETGCRKCGEHRSGIEIGGHGPKARLRRHDR
jgi:hypothetical protein